MTAAGPVAPVLRVSALTKAFGPTKALQGVDVEVGAGTVHALLGGNGSGKSTLVKILAGVHQADGGTIELDGRTWPARSYRVADGERHGLRFVHQDLGLIDTATIAENMAFTEGFPTTSGGRISWRRLHARTAELLGRFEIDVDPRTPVSALRPADRTMVAIARALGDQDGPSRSILVLDEPTASLPAHESELLLESVRRRARAGQTVVLISHHLGEVLDVADDITVLRDGRTSGRLTAAEADTDSVLALIAGRAVAAMSRRDPAPDEGAPALQVRGLAAGPLEDVDLDVAAGEIVGVIGLLGSGRSSLVRAVFGDLPRRAGTVRVGARTLNGSGPSEAMHAGVALVPEDRPGDAAFADHSVSDNLTAAVLRRYWRTGVMRRRRQTRDAAELIDRFGVRTESPGVPLSSLSGGNQQKTVLARWLRREPSVLLLDEPTQGVDAVSRAEIYRLVRSASDAGCAVVVASSDADELAILCDRAIVLAGGRVAAHVGPDEMDPDLLTRLTHSAHAATTRGATT